ncbi:hypothetical protein HDV00_008832 [Rhizophlyctis rosea]|nr:hypothetical protein HDV00_008832 [Rhizophlyctis rosea]
MTVSSSPNPRTSRRERTTKICTKCSNPVTPWHPDQPEMRLVCVAEGVEPAVYTVGEVCAKCGSDMSVFATISHTWGQTAQMDISAVRNVPWKVPLSRLGKIDEMIGLVRGSGFEWMWVDVLCIDQSNDKDKKRQVLNMRHYYSNCKLCFALLDSTALRNLQLLQYSADYADTVLRRVYDEVSGVYETCGGNSTTFIKVKPRWDWEADYRKAIGILERNLNQLEILSRDAWMRRVWTLQEGVLPPRLILVGTDGNHVDLSTIGDCFTWWLQVDDIYYDRVATRRSAVHSLYRYILVGSRAKEIEWESDSGSSVEEDDYEAHQQALDRLTFMDVIGATVGRAATLPEDRVYGVIGLLKYGEAVDVQYGIGEQAALERLMTTAAKAGDLSFLANAGAYLKEDGKCFVPNIAEGIDFNVYSSVVTEDSFAEVTNNGLRVMGVNAGKVMEIASVGTLTWCNLLKSLSVLKADKEHALSCLLPQWEDAREIVRDLLDPFVPTAANDSQLSIMQLQHILRFKFENGARTTTEIVKPSETRDLGIVPGSTKEVYIVRIDGRRGTLWGLAGGTGAASIQVGDDCVVLGVSTAFKKMCLFAEVDDGVVHCSASGIIEYEEQWWRKDKRQVTIA